MRLPRTFAHGTCPRSEPLHIGRTTAPNPSGGARPRAARAEARGRTRAPDAHDGAPGVRSPRIVAVGGGTGVPQVLAGLADAPVEVTAVVTTSDDGGSSGELRRAYGIPAPGDVRNCLVALARRPSLLAALFQHRFGGAGALAGHTVGNVVLAALAQRLGDFRAAVRAAAELLGARGAVLPATDGAADLVAQLEDGRVVRGETAIARARGRIRKLSLDRAVPVSREVPAALAAADLVVLGPGSLYSSVLASLVQDGVREALLRCGGTRVLVVNLFTEPGETDGFDAADHVAAVERHLGPVVDAVLVHRGRFPPPMLRGYAREGAFPVRVDRPVRAGVRSISADLLAAGGAARHDPSKLARALLSIATRRRGATAGERTGASRTRPPSSDEPASSERHGIRFDARVRRTSS